jgi:N-acetylmuramoyl-L-alanine amidase
VNSDVYYIQYTMSRLSFILISALSVSLISLPLSGLRADTLTFPHLEVIIPETDTVRTDLSRYRIAANSDSSSKAFINGKQVKVYPSGAFVGMVTLERGENIVTLSAVSAEGDTVSREFVIIRPQEMTSSPDDPLVIEDYYMLPRQDFWLSEGDVLEVRFKGSPGHDASFEIPGVVKGAAMDELPPERTGGVRGIYVGYYKVEKGDFADDVSVRFRLRKSFWTSIDTESPGRVSIMPDQFPFIAEVRGTRPFFNAGLGTDRLGGARLGFIVPGILLQVDGRIGNLYRVRLADDMTVWIQSQFVDILSSGTPPPRALAGSISSAGSAAADVVTLELGRKLPYLTQQQVNPNRIIVDIYGATSNTTWITQHLSAEGIRNITWEQVSTDLYRLILELNHPVHWGHRIEYTDYGNMHIVIRRPPVLDDEDDILRGRVIALDAGHGGNNRGALGATGAMEKDVNFAITKRLEEKLLERGATVIMTRNADYDLIMQRRVESVLESNPDIIVSVHANSIGYASDPERVRGTSTYYRHIGFKPLADLIYRRLLTLGLAEFGVVGSFNFLLNDMAEVPNVLVETAFMSNPEDEMMLLDAEMQMSIAEAIIEGIESYLLILQVK